jgi:KaiC/GvpD/RAD55 family RecA-like ATPase
MQRADGLEASRGSLSARLKMFSRRLEQVGDGRAVREAPLRQLAAALDQLASESLLTNDLSVNSTLAEVATALKEFRPGWADPQWPSSSPLRPKRIRSASQSTS